MNKVIACIDGSRSSLSVCDHAAWAAKSLEAPLTLLHVIHKPQGIMQADLSGNLNLGGREALLEKMVETEEAHGKLLREQGRAILADGIARLKAQGIKDPGMLLRNDNVTSAINSLQDEARLVIIGKQGQDGDMLTQHIGSHLESIIRILNRPILVTPLDFKQPQRFMVAYDGSKTADKVVEKIAQSPLLKGLDAHILMVAKNRQRQVQLDQAAEHLRQTGFTVYTDIRSGEVSPTVSAYKQEHEIHLLAMGAYGHSTLRRWFVGSTTTNMIMQSEVPLLILR